MSTLSLGIMATTITPATYKTVKDDFDICFAQRQKLAAIMTVFRTLAGIGTAVAEVCDPFTLNPKPTAHWFVCSSIHFLRRDLPA